MAYWYLERPQAATWKGDRKGVVEARDGGLKQAPDIYHCRNMDDPPKASPNVGRWHYTLGAAQMPNFGGSRKATERSQVSLTSPQRPYRALTSPVNTPRDLEAPFGTEPTRWSPERAARYPTALA
jgi:hypothetical protein